ncbi:MAG: protease HtpX [Cyanobacteria bacterium TGS_CYA1]|nr:protease HtpX [Cyanobacteria bacterium TGS_CYA1]
MAKRVVLFLLVNALVVFTISIITSSLGLNGYLRDYGLDQGSLMLFCAVWGMGGAFISLLMSRAMAKWTMNVQIIDSNTQDPELRELVEVIYRLSKQVGLTQMPEVGIYQGQELNAFATGPTKSMALVAVSTGLLQRMNRDEIEAVLGHEISHVANGDMVTMTLLQGVVNAFVMFFARILAYALTAGRQGDGEQRGVNLGAYYLVQMLLEIVFMLLGSIVVAWFSRLREFRADAGGAKLSGTRNMVNALQALKTYSEERAVPANLKTLMISEGRSPLMNLFASHPPLDDRIARLMKDKVQS